MTIGEKFVMNMIHNVDFTSIFMNLPKRRKPFISVRTHSGVNRSYE